MKIIVTGLPLFAKRLVSDLNEYNQKKEFIFLDTYYSKWARLKFILFLPFVDGVFSMNGVSDKSGSLDLVLFFKKKLWLQWVGTDVLLAYERHQSKTIFRKYIDYKKTKNVTDASWLQNELEKATIHSSINIYKYLPNKLKEPNSYEKIEVLTYIAQARQTFYGLKKVIDIAEQNPTIIFHVIGTNNPDFKSPENIIFHGWVEEKQTFDMMSKYPIFLRLTEHDGLSVSVIEALSLGNEIIYSYKLDFTHCADDTNYQEVFKQAIECVESRGLKPNIEAVNFYRKEYDKQNVIKRLYSELHDYFGK